MEPGKYQSDEEIDLMDYVKIVLKRKLFILAIFLLALLAAGLFSFLSPQVYQINTVLEIGGANDQLVENPDQLMGRIEGDVYGAIIRSKLNISEAEYPTIKAHNPENTNLVSRSIESSKTKQTKQILEEANKLIIADHQNKLELEKELLKKKITTAEANISVAESDIARVERKISSLEEEKNNLGAKVVALEAVLVYQQDPGTQFALFDAKEKLEAKKQEIENRYLEINSLELQINDLASEIDSLESKIQDIRPTKVIKQPTISERPIRPKPLFNMAVAGILGLFVGIILAFCGEWWQRSNT